MLQNETPLPEIVLRVAVLYLVLIAMIRLTGKREVGQLSPLDLLAMLILAETVSPALTGQDRSLTASLVAAGVLLLLSAGIGRLTASSRRAQRWIDGTPAVIAREGRLLEAAMRRERITPQELESAMRRNGLDQLSRVRLAVVEPDGSISIVPRH
jgi:uncharacterized membrane protein YcaP (DUF421 family)